MFWAPDGRTDGISHFEEKKGKWHTGLSWLQDMHLNVKPRCCCGLKEALACFSFSNYSAQIRLCAVFGFVTFVLASLMHFTVVWCVVIGRDSDSVRAGLSGDRLPVGGRDFPHLSTPALGPTQPTIQWVPGLFPPGVKQPWRGVNHTPSTSADVKERVELYHYSWAFMTCFRATFTFTFFLVKDLLLVNLKIESSYVKL